MPQLMVLDARDSTQRSDTALSGLLPARVRRDAGSSPMLRRDLKSRRGRLPLHRDLDGLAGTWAPDDAQDFDESQRAFETVDEDLWR